jgi:hypothetical protein
MDNEVFEYYVNETKNARSALCTIADLLRAFRRTSDPLTRGEILLRMDHILEAYDQSTAVN